LLKQKVFEMKNMVMLVTLGCALLFVARPSQFVAAEFTVAGQTVAAEVVSESGPQESPTVEWFKEELRITPKYTEGHQGVWGLSWAHFLTMVLLAGFSVSGLVFLLVRYRRTQELLTQLLEKEKKGES
jgi:hypothetical protein